MRRQLLAGICALVLAGCAGSPRATEVPRHDPAEKVSDWSGAGEGWDWPPGTPWHTRRRAQAGPVPDAPARVDFPQPVEAPPVSPFERTLADCIVRARDGDAPRCRFPRPLDEMDYGQRHCDELCTRRAR